MNSKRIWIIVVGFLALTTCGIFVYDRSHAVPAETKKAQASGTSSRYQIVGEYPHDAPGLTHRA